MDKNQYLVSLEEIEGTLAVASQPVTSRSLGRHHNHYTMADTISTTPRLCGLIIRRGSLVWSLAVST
ncbi:hypothetical protein DPMN_029994 [Dreissena polymorpha]|uniref:Uncharacterized protein n=1 Tax=Dreissena polymorpha TaxID=45954 RepID=A0A9D4LZJ8_DREPO|nr:hypothetical protein DPMN_183799 [Dreissena polymorpha]KAH3866871.1 hypothetical protein DPMN_029994 [Dreissena polymorpha]